MSMVCPQCNGLFDQYLQCPTCGVRLSYQPGGQGSGAPAAGPHEPWQHTGWGRLLVGLLVTQGLAYGLRMLCDAGVLVGEGEEGQGVWATLLGLILLQGLQGVSLLVGGALAGASRRHGILLGGVLGLCNAVVALCIQYANHEPITEVLFYGLPALHLAFGAAGGLIGTLIWKPLPTISLASAPGEKKAGAVPRGKTSLAFVGPISWGRVLLGTAVVVVGVLWPKVILEFVLDASQGKMNVNSHLQAELVTWEVSALAVLLGAGLAGAGTLNGPKQGLCVALFGGLAFVGVHLGSNKFVLEPTLFTLICMGALSLVGGWFGCHLFPLVCTAPRRKRFSGANGEC